MSHGLRARIELASRNVETGDSLYTFVLRYPRFIHSEVMTHRVFSKNAASSRAIPAKKMRRLVMCDPATPWHIGAAQKGMQAGAPLTGWRYEAARFLYGAARYVSPLLCHYLMEKLGVHKQVGNRLLEPWMWMQTVCSSTEMDNFYGLREHKDAEPHFQELAKEMHQRTRTADRLIDGTFNLNDALDGTIVKTQSLRPGHWHTPFAHDGPIKNRLIVSAARCARSSYYLPEDGTMSTFDKDQAMYDRLSSSTPIHASPFEHVARASYTRNPAGSANFRGFIQLRNFIENKNEPI